MSKWWLVLCLAGLCLAQESDPTAELRKSLQEASGSPVEVMRAFERFLHKYPKAAERDDVEKALIKIALEQHDNARIIQFGEPMLSREPNNLQLLDRVPRALLVKEDAITAARALPIAKQFEQAVQKLEKEQPPAGREAGRMRDELGRAYGRALFYQAKASGILGRVPEAIALAKQSFDQYPTADAARETGRWLARSGKPDEALRYYAEAFAIPDSRVSEADRSLDRQRLGELYRQLKGSETGLGDMILQAYDRTSVLVTKRREAIEATDPNGQAKSPLDYTLSALEGEALPLATLKGKVIVMDFWATWCGPCRVQHPLYEQVKKTFADRKDVVFLAVNADEDHSAVKPFVTAQKWNQRIYFEDGLSNFLQVSSLPTTLIFDKRGELVNRLNGFVPERFVDMLTERIQEAIR